MTEQKQDPVNELFQMISATSARANEMGISSIVLVGLFQHAANVQSMALHAQMLQKRSPTVAEQIMANARSGPVQ